MVKRCARCGEEKLVSMFYMEANGQPRSRCIECYSAIRKKARAEPFWSEAEDAAICENYPAGGWEACGLTGRSAHAIKNRAYRLGVHMIRAGTTEKWRRVKEPPFGIPADDRPEEIKALDMALRSFRLCEPAQNLTWRIAA